MNTNQTTSPINPGKYLPDKPALRKKTIRRYRRRGLLNLLKMGHCAPAVMKTLLDLENTKNEGLVRMTAGLPGGIGNTGFECGGITASLVKFGLKKGLNEVQDGLPAIIPAGHEYIRQFGACNKAILCREILGNRRVPLPCIKVVRHAPELYWQTVGKDNSGTITGETREAFRLLYAHFSANDFHCAHAVFKQMDYTIPVTRELLDGTSGFIGGTVFKGLTCSAFTAGLMTVGLKLGEIENSYFRVIRMLATMMAGGNALADDINKFNRLINTGNGMAKWFRTEFGSCLCNEVTNCDFSSLADVRQYIKKGSVSTCKMIAEKVARQTERIILQNAVRV